MFIRCREVVLKSGPQAIRIGSNVSFSRRRDVHAKNEEGGLGKSDVCAREEAKVRWVNNVVICSAGPEGGDDDELSPDLGSLMWLRGDGRGGLTSAGQGFPTAALGSMLFRARAGGMESVGGEAVGEEAFGGCA